MPEPREPNVPDTADLIPMTPEQEREDYIRRIRAVGSFDELLNILLIKSEYKDAFLVIEKIKEGSERLIKNMSTNRDVADKAVTAAKPILEDGADMYDVNKKFLTREQKKRMTVNRKKINLHDEELTAIVKSRVEDLIRKEASQFRENKIKKEFLKDYRGSTPIKALGEELEK